MLEMGGGVSKEMQRLMLDAVASGDNFKVKRLISTIHSRGAVTSMVNSLVGKDQEPLLVLAVDSGDLATVQVGIMYKHLWVGALQRLSSAPAKMT